MKILNFEYAYSNNIWKLDSTNFTDLTLLVGISGVGKSRILHSILNCRRVALGISSSPGTSWNIKFITSDDKVYEWSGEIEGSIDQDAPGSVIASVFQDEDSGENKDESKFISEQIILDGKILATRNASEIIFKNGKMPRLNPFESILQIFSEEEEIYNIQKEFKKILIRDNTDSKDFIHAIYDFKDWSVIRNKYSTVDEIKDARIPVLTKLALTFHHKRNVFHKIKTRFIEIFPQVEDFKMESLSAPDVPYFLKNTPVIQIKEKGVSKWLTQEELSSGMLRTLIHLCDLFLCPKNSVILIDEFENSLGVNCIDVITDDIMTNSSDIQFILTSHHPYIINRIPISSWKIVRRNGSFVWTSSAHQLGIGLSSHDSFIQLLNSSDFSDGITNK